MNRSAPLNVLVLAGGPDRERPVSLESGKHVAAALREAGHAVRSADIGPEMLEALDAFAAWPGDVIFPALHGSWGEGGGLQAILDQRGLCYVGCRADAARLCMDKHATKQALRGAGLLTPDWQVVEADEPCALPPPVVVKPIDEGSSLGLAICHDAAAFAAARRSLHAEHCRLMVETFIAGQEMTVGLIAEPGGGDLLRPLPPIHIRPAAAFYDYEAKYTRDDTQYCFEIDLPAAIQRQMVDAARAACDVLAVRHLGRVDFIVDRHNQPWLLEVNTIPGFTGHSLVPMAAKAAGMNMPALCDQLVRVALSHG